MADVRISTDRRFQTATIRAETPRALTWLRGFTVMHVSDLHPVVVVDIDGVAEYADAARGEGLEVVT